MNVENFLTGELIDINKASKLLDGEYVDSFMYTHCVRTLKKCPLDKADILYCLDIEDKLDKAMELMETNIRKASAITGKKVTALLNSFINEEKIRSLGMFKKERTCLSIPEHTELIVTTVTEGLLSEYYEQEIEYKHIKFTEEHKHDYLYGIEHCRVR